MGSRPALSTSSTWPPSDIYHGPDTAATAIAVPTTAAPTGVDTTPIAAPTNFTSDDITKLRVMMDAHFARRELEMDEYFALCTP